MNENSSKPRKGNIKRVSKIQREVNALDKVIFKKPQICFIDIEDKIKDNLMKKGFNIQSGTLGKAVKVPNMDYYSSNNHKCLANYYFPKNLHEYDIIVLDLKEKEEIPYDVNEHIHKNVEGSSDYFFLSLYPENLFNPIGFGSHQLGHEISQITSHLLILIVFTSEYKENKYKLYKQGYHGAELVRELKYSNYHFYPEILNLLSNRMGKELTVLKESNEYKLYYILNKYIEDSSYSVVFRTPKINGSSEVFVPLIKNSHNEVVSFLRIYKNYVLFVFPQIIDKDSFLCELLTDQLIDLIPALFPSHTQFKWLEEKAYMLPNHEYFLELKDSSEKEYEEKIRRLDKEIETNDKKYKCLHHLLTETGDELVKHVKAFLEWLGFKDVRIMDDKKAELLEEDLQVNIEEGLLVIEVKGTGGTSTDEQCSQIEKIKKRRIKERNNTDVFGLYIVNHQRHQPPLKRENPPFKEYQIQDAKNDGRGLLSTWQLFKLYYLIRNKIITKEESRKAFLTTGLIEFVPQDCIPLGRPKNYLSRNRVIILDLCHKVEINDKLIIKRNDDFLQIATILEIEVNNEKVKLADCGIVGLKIDIDIKKSDKLFLKNN